MNKQSIDHPEQSEIREILNKICPSIDELKVFVLDYFAEIHQSLQGPDYSHLDYMNKFLLCLSANLNGVWNAIERHRPNHPVVLNAREKLENRKLLQKTEQYYAAIKNRINELETVKRILRIDYGISIDARIDDDLNRLTAASSSPWTPDQKIDNRFVLNALIGSGGVAEIWSAYDEVHKRMVALRFLLSSKRSEQWLCGRFVRGLEELKKLTNKEIIPGLVGVLEVIYAKSSSTGVDYGVLEFVQGGSIEQLIRNSKISFKERQLTALKIIIGLGHLLDKLHAHGIVHCDITPSNILFTDGSSNPRLTDFDAAMIISNANSDQTRVEAETQRSLTVRIATKSFCAPELESNDLSKSLTGKIDIYSLAMTTLAILCADPRPDRIIINREIDEFDDLAPKLRSLPGSFKKLLGRALNKEPSRRHDSASAFCDELKLCIEKEKMFERDGYIPISAPNLNEGRISQLKAPIRSIVALVLICIIAFTTWKSISQISNNTAMNLGNESMDAGFNQQIRSVKNKVFIADLSIQSQPNLSHCTNDAGNELNNHQNSTCPNDMWPIRTAQTSSYVDEPFWIDVHEVTLNDYLRCTKEGICSQLTGEVILPALETEEKDSNIQEKFNSLCNTEKDLATKKEHPVNCVNINQAIQYCRWKGKRLPKANEWDFAARGSDTGRKYPWGNNPPAAGWVNACGDECISRINEIGINKIKKFKNWFIHAYKDNARDNWPTTAPVTSRDILDRSSYYISDMGGNVSEWVLQDGAGCIDGNGKYKCKFALIKGGSWSSPAADLLIDIKNQEDRKKPPMTQSYAIGFRCAQDWTLNSNR